MQRSQKKIFLKKEHPYKDPLNVSTLFFFTLSSALVFFVLKILGIREKKEGRERAPLEEERKEVFSLSLSLSLFDHRRF